MHSSSFCCRAAEKPNYGAGLASGGDHTQFSVFGEDEKRAACRFALGSKRETASRFFRALGANGKTCTSPLTCSDTV
jgi:hypothetical protein